MKILSPQIRKYQRINAACLLGYLAILHFLNADRPSESVAIVAAIGFSLLLMGMMLTSAIILIQKRDEFQRNLLNQAILWGIGSTMTLTVVWGTLQEFAHIQPLHALLVFPIFISATAIAKLILFRLTRAVDE